MASTNLLFALGILFLFVYPTPPCSALSLRSYGFDAIYQLGDSLSDIGNLIREHPLANICARFPYGESFCNHSPTGRCSNGLLMIYCFALSAGIPLLDAYLNANASFSHGVDFAVAGSTALPIDVLVRKRILSLITNSPLNVQLDWMFSYLTKTWSNDNESLEKIKKSIFMVGEIEVMTTTLHCFTSVEDVKTNVLPDVIRAIKDAGRRVIGYGAIRVVVPGSFPVGCFPIFLTVFHTNHSSAYDELHCLKDFNDLSTYHNEHLKQAIQELQKDNPHVTIVYGDNYNAFLWSLHNIGSIGFDVTTMQKVCCGIGGEYNFNNPLKWCGAAGVPVCPDPDKSISWDGVHLTQKAYQYLSACLIDDIFPKLQCP